MVGTAVANLDKLETIVPAVQDLGRRHATYGVQSAYYDTVASALLWTLGQGLEMLSRRRWRPLGRKPIRSLPR